MQLKVKSLEAAEMAQRLMAHTAFTPDPGSGPNSPTRQLTTAQGIRHPLPDLLGTRYPCGAQGTCTFRQHTHTHQIFLKS